MFSAKDGFGQLWYQNADIHHYLKQTLDTFETLVTLFMIFMYIYILLELNKVCKGFPTFEKDDVDDDIVYKVLRHKT